MRTLVLNILTDKCYNPDSPGDSLIPDAYPKEQLYRSSVTFVTDPNGNTILTKNRYGKRGVILNQSEIDLIYEQGKDAGGAEMIDVMTDLHNDSVAHIKKNHQEEIESLKSVIHQLVLEKYSK